MTYRITRKEVTKQFIIVIQLLLEWIEQGEDSNERKDIDSYEENPLEPRPLSVSEVARNFNISKSSAYQ